MHSIDICRLLYYAFQHARHAAPNAPLVLAKAAAAVHMAARQRTLTVRISDVDPHDLWPSDADDTGGGRGRNRLDARNEPFFHYAWAGVAELQRLYGGPDDRVLREVGYALHNVPAFIRDPASFDAESYKSCIGLIAPHFSVLSEPFKAALALIMQVDVGTLERHARLIARERVTGS